MPECAADEIVKTIEQLGKSAVLPWSVQGPGHRDCSLRGSHCYRTGKQVLGGAAIGAADGGGEQPHVAVPPRSCINLPLPLLPPPACHPSMTSWRKRSFASTLSMGVEAARQQSEHRARGGQNATSG
jgi:hypothetical protein